ncbi:hypothetical protein V5O48_004025 [Marasmius crinis-equi]|uniref:Uncharacterized protein n=1 Tax=Marasmius crinis-equi TaxID=585013 RepID=A0ABR3FRR1_9AGAR
MVFGKMNEVYLGQIGQGGTIIPEIYMSYIPATSQGPASAELKVLTFVTREGSGELYTEYEYEKRAKGGGGRTQKALDKNFGASV